MLCKAASPELRLGPPLLCAGGGGAVVHDGPSRLSVILKPGSAGEMASYFEEHDCDPTNAEEQYRQNALLELARSLLAGMDLDLGQVDFSDWEHRLPPAAKKEIVKNLPTLPVTPEQADRGLKCPVCLLEFEEEEAVKKMPCEHFFHSACIVPWLGKTNSCPLCRLELPTDNEEYEEYKQEKERRKQKEQRLEYLHGAMYT